MNNLAFTLTLVAALTTAGCAGLGSGASDSDSVSSTTSLSDSNRGGPRVDDSEIVSSIKAAFREDSQLATANISVTSNNGTVTLSGSAPSAQAYNRAISLARSAPGVRPPVNAANLKF